MEYTQLDPTSRITAVKARIRELESSHMQLSLMINTPGINQPPNEMDRQNLQVLESSLARLHEMERELGNGSNAAS